MAKYYYVGTRVSDIEHKPIFEIVKCSKCNSELYTTKCEEPKGELVYLCNICGLKMVKKMPPSMSINITSKMRASMEKRGIDFHELRKISMYKLGRNVEELD